MSAGNYAALWFSGCALAISVYGVWERRRDGKRNEWLRLTGTIADLDALFFEQAKTPDGFSPGDFANAVNSRREVLSFQALALLPRFHQKITSSELRVLAYALNRAGYPSESQQIWRRATTVAKSEGPTQSLFAHRGYAYFLFSLGRTDDGRTQMREAISVAGEDDDLVVKAIETLKFWAAEEAPGELAGKLLSEAESLANRITAPRLRARADQVLSESTGEAPSRPAKPD